MPLTKIEQITASRSIALWSINETEVELLKQLNPADEERNKLLAFKHETKRLEWLSARLVVRKLASHMSIDYDGIFKNENGKPILKNASAELSISHSYPYVAAVIDYHLDVGIDIEQPKEKLKLIAHKFSSKKELEYSKNDITKLCVIWSAKEALYKIYSKKGLVFNDHMFIEPFELSSHGTITGHLNVTDCQKKYKLDYHVVGDYVLVYNID